MKEGKIYVFTGEGKGKTSAALGVTVRALLLKKKVCWISFYKGRDWQVAEKSLPEKFENLEMYMTGEGFRIGEKMKKVAGGKGVVVDRASEEEHQQAAKSGMELAKDKVESGEYFLVVLDELNNAIAEGLVDLKEAVEVLLKRGETHVVVTGRGVHMRLEGMADLVTECKKVKHPYDKGELAVRGLDF